MPVATRTFDVHHAEGVEKTRATLAPLQEFSVDLEADALHAFSPRLCFVQIGTDEDIFLFDTLIPEVTLSPLKELFADPARTKFIHAAMGDLQFLAEVGVRVQGLFDTHRAATLLGLPRVGLADLVEQACGVRLAKAHQQDDFSIRPLPDNMREYIADDVRYLTEVGRRVKAQCVEKDILEEVELDCRRMADEALERPATGADFRPKIPRNGLSPERLRVVEAVCWAMHEKRLAWAKAEDIPMGRMVSNAAVVAMAMSQPTTLQALQRCEGIRRGFVKTHGELALATIAGVLEQAKAGTLPPSREAPRKDSRERKRSDVLVEFRNEAAKARGITGSAVLPNALVEELASRPPESVDALRAFPYFGEKRIRLYGQALVKLLANYR